MRKKLLNRLFPKRKSSRIEQLLVKLICVKQAQITAEQDYFRDYANSFVLESDKEEWDKMIQTEKRIESLRDYLTHKEKEYMKELVSLSPFLGRQLEQMIVSSCHDYNIFYHEKNEIYFPIPAVLDEKEPGHNMPLGTFKNSEEACRSMYKKKENKVIFQLRGNLWTPHKN